MCYNIYASLHIEYKFAMYIYINVKQCIFHCTLPDQQVYMLCTYFR